MSLAQAIPTTYAAPRRVASAPRRPLLRLVPDLAQAEPALRAADLYRDYGPAVYRRCRRLLRDTDAAADATQEVFLRLVRHGEALSTRSDLLPWLYRVATNYCLNVLRDVRGHGEEELDQVHEPSHTPSGSAPDARLVHQILAQFDEVTQAIAVGVIVEGMETEELARQMGVSRRTISRKLDRFLAEARAYVEGGLQA